MHHRNCCVTSRKLVTARPQVLSSIVLGILCRGSAPSPCLIPLWPGVHSAILSQSREAPAVFLSGWSHSLVGLETHLKRHRNSFSCLESILYISFKYSWKWKKKPHQIGSTCPNFDCERIYVTVSSVMPKVFVQSINVIAHDAAKRSSSCVSKGLKTLHTHFLSNYSRTWFVSVSTTVLLMSQRGVFERPAGVPSSRYAVFCREWMQFWGHTICVVGSVGNVTLNK